MCRIRVPPFWSFDISEFTVCVLTFLKVKKMFWFRRLITFHNDVSFKKVLQICQNLAVLYRNYLNHMVWWIVATNLGAGNMSVSWGKLLLFCEDALLTINAKELRKILRCLVNDSLVRAINASRVLLWGEEQKQ